MPAALALMHLMSLISGLILDTVVKGSRKEYELLVIRAYAEQLHRDIEWWRVIRFLEWARG